MGGNMRKDIMTQEEWCEEGIYRTYKEMEKNKRRIQGT